MFFNLAEMIDLHANLLPTLYDVLITVVRDQTQWSRVRFPVEA